MPPRNHEPERGRKVFGVCAAGDPEPGNKKNARRCRRALKRVWEVVG